MPEAGVDNPFFARFWAVMASREPEALRRLRAEMLAGLSGRVLEVGAGTGTNFRYYPTGVQEVVALEPERRLRRIAHGSAAAAPVPVTVTARTAEDLEPAQPFDAAVCSLVLCSVSQPEMVLRQLFSALRPGGELRYLEHVATRGVRGRLQTLADATVWPLLFGNCHTHRDTVDAIGDAGFITARVHRERHVPAWLPTPVAELVLGTAIRPG